MNGTSINPISLIDSFQVPLPSIIETAIDSSPVVIDASRIVFDLVEDSDEKDSTLYEKKVTVLDEKKTSASFTTIESSSKLSPTIYTKLESGGNKISESGKNNPKIIIDIENVEEANNISNSIVAPSKSDDVPDVIWMGTNEMNRPKNCPICMDEMIYRTYKNEDEKKLNSQMKEKSPDLTSLGFTLRCKHTFCVSCIQSLVQHSVNDKKLPLKCPECPEQVRPNEIFVLFQDTPEERKVFDNFTQLTVEKDLQNESSSIYCPNKSCSEIIMLELGAASNHQVVCPYCKQKICCNCKVMWHEGLTCSDYQDRTENQELFDLAKKRKWQRCPKCKAVVEKNTGCNHITCKCSCEFCYLCGKVYLNRRPNCDCSSREIHDRRTTPGTRPGIHEIRRQQMLQERIRIQQMMHQARRTGQLNLSRGLQQLHENRRPLENEAQIMEQRRDAMRLQQFEESQRMNRIIRRHRHV